MENISEAEASILSIGHPRVEGAFVFVSALHSVLLHPRFHPSPPNSACLALPVFLHPFHRTPFLRKGVARIDRASEESIMKLFKFVSNIEISFMPGKLIIEIYRRTRSWPSVQEG